jgi:hypothetical protein
LEGPSHALLLLPQLYSLVFEVLDFSCLSNPVGSFDVSGSASINVASFLPLFTPFSDFVSLDSKMVVQLCTPSPSLWRDLDWIQRKS